MILRWVLALVAGTLLLWLGLSSLRGAMAHAASEQPGRLMETWRRTGVEPGRDAWTEARNGLERAVRLAPGSAQLQEGLGLLLAQPYRDGPDVVVFGSAALERVRVALRERPASPFTWAHLVLFKYRLGEVDAELYQALDNAMLLGPWEPEVQLIVADIGFALLDEMPATLREKVLANAVNGMKRQANQIVRIAERRGRLTQLCAPGNGMREHPGCAALTSPAL